MKSEWDKLGFGLPDQSRREELFVGGGYQNNKMPT